MNLVKFYYTIGFLFIEKLTNTTLIENYRENVFSIIKNFIKKNQYNSYTKKFCIENLRQTDVALKTFLKNNNEILNKNEKKYIRDLINLVIQFRRFVLYHDAKFFPRIIIQLTTVELKTFITNLSQNHKMSPKITFIDKQEYETIYKLAVERAIVTENLIFTEPYSSTILDNSEKLYK